MESLARKDEDDQFVEMKTLCIDKRAVKMPSNDEHKFLKFCGLGKRIYLAQFIAFFAILFCCNSSSICRHVGPSVCLSMNDEF